MGLKGLLSKICDKCSRAMKCIRSMYQDSPMMFIVVLLVLTILILLGSLFTRFVARYVGSRGAAIVDLTLFWLFARFVARSLLFPGSLKLFQRNTEASFRSEMARQYAHYLRQVLVFLRQASNQSDGVLRGVSIDGILRGVLVIETLTASLIMQQQQHEVKLSDQQREILSLAQDIDRYLKGTQVRPPGRGGQEGPQVPLIEWLRHQEEQGVPIPTHVLWSTKLVGNADDTAQGLDKIDQLLVTLDELRHPQRSFIASTMRFLRVPAVGSLNQLRTELQIRYGGHRVWVKSGRRKIDAMFIPCDGDKKSGGTDEVSQEDVPLKESRSPVFSGPTVVWCNPNAAYYETMVYQGHWLNFWLSQGINILFFNYSGYGASSGSPSPSKIADDGEAVIQFLKSKGITQICVYGRSIGGVTACQLARKNPDVVKLLIADRTMGQLTDAAKYLYGGWAAKGLQITRMVHNNSDNFLEVRAYKLLIVDPKDTMILDLAALRTAIALRVVERMSSEERFAIDKETLLGLADVWKFFQALFNICENEEEGTDGAGGHSARQPRFAQEEGTRLKAGDGGAGEVPGSGSGGLRDAQWLQDNANFVRSFMSPMVDQIRSTLDTVGENIEGGGTSLHDAFFDNPSDPCFAVQCMLANLQVWGTLGDQTADACDLSGNAMQSASSSEVYSPSVSEQDIRHFLRKDFSQDFAPGRTSVSPDYLREVGKNLTPEMLCTFHRRLTRTRVALVRKEFRRRVSALQSSFSQFSSGTGSDAHAAEQALFRTISHHLSTVESFVANLGRFFKNVDLSLPYSRHQSGQQHGASSGASESTSVQDPTPLSDSSDEKWLDSQTDPSKGNSLQPQPFIDRAFCGYIMHIDCGHNGVMDEVDTRQLALHMRASRFVEPKA